MSGMEVKGQEQAVVKKPIRVKGTRKKKKKKVTGALNSKVTLVTQGM